MGLKAWLHGWKRPRKTSPLRRPRRPASPTARLDLELLERRIVPTVTWTGTSGDWNWNTAGNWSGGSIPAATDDVVIPALSGHTIGIYGAADTVHGVMSGTNLALSSGTLTVVTTLQLTSPAVLTVTGGTLANATVTSGSTVAFVTTGPTFAGITIAAGATLDGTGGDADGDENSVDPEEAAVAYVTGGLTLNGTAKLGSADGATNGHLQFINSNQTLAGNGTVLFSSSLYNAVEAVGNGGNGPVTLTIASGITIRGGSGTITGVNAADTFISSATINVASGQFLTLGGANWQNKGTITATGATVALGGSFTPAALGNFTCTGGLVNLTGALTNTTPMLNLTPALGAWRLEGGSINGGTISMSGGSTLALSGSGGTLAGVTIPAGTTVDATQNINSAQDYVFITGGLDLNGALNLGSADGAVYGRVYFHGVGNQTLTGTGAVTFGTSVSNGMWAQGDDSTHPTTLVIDTTTTVQGVSGTISGFYTAFAGYAGDTFINNGTITLTGGGTLTLGGVNWTNTSPGTITANGTAGGSTVNLRGVFTMDSLGAFTDTGGTANIVGTLNNTNNNAVLSPPLGAWFLDGGTINGGTISTTGGSTLALRAGGTLNAVTIAAGTTVDGTQFFASDTVLGGLTLNGTLDLGSPTNANNYAQFYFRGNGSQTLTGTGVVNLGAAPSEGLWAEGDDSTHPTTLVIDTGITIDGKSGTITGSYGAFAGYTGDTFVNKATISLTGGGTLTLGGVNWTNAAAITANGAGGGSTVNLGGSFNMTGLGDFTDNGGTVYLTGTLNNNTAGSVVILRPALGAWYLDGGTLNGGVVTSTGGAKLGLTANGGTLAAVTIAASTSVDGSQNVNGVINFANVTGGLVLYGPLSLGSANGAVMGRLYFKGTQTLGGNGTITLGNSTTNAVFAQGNGGGSPATLTIGGQVTIQGGAGSVSGFYGNDVLVNAGTILGSAGQTLTLGGGNSTNSGLIGLAGGTVKLIGTSFTNTVGGLITGHGTWTPGAVNFIDNGLAPDLAAPSLYDVSFNVQLTTIAVTFDATTAMTAATVTNAANYTLLGSGGDGVFGNGNDVDQSGLISSISYDAAKHTATLQLAGPLPDDFYRVELNGDAVQSTLGAGLLPGQVDLVNRQENDRAGQVTVTLDPASDSGVSNHDGVTNDRTPTFDVQVNQAGLIGFDFTGSGAFTTTLFASAAGTYQLTAPTLIDGVYAATATFSAVSGALGQGSAGYTLTTVGANVTASSPSGTVGTRLGQATVTFNKPIDLTSLTPAAVTLSGPAGPISVYQPQHLTGNAYVIYFPTQTTQGTYTLTIAPTVADLAGNLLDQDKDGVNGAAVDAFSGSFTLALPELAVAQTSAPASAVEGTSIPVTWQVANLSTANPTVSAWVDDVYLSSKTTLDGSAIFLTSLNGPSTPVAPSGSYGRSTSVSLPGYVAAGNYNLLFVANADGGQLESDYGNDSNDVAAVPIALTAADLQVAGVSGPANGYTGETVLVSWTDVNNGTAPATGPWFDNVYTAATAQGGNPTLLGRFEFDGTLAPGASAQRTQQVILPQTAGTEWFAVTTNADGAVSEGAAYGNDTTVATASISVLAVPLPDLVVSSITPPPNGVFSGTSVPLSFVVTNQGQAPTSVPVWQDWVILSQDATLAQTYQGQLNPTGPGGDQTLNNQPIVVSATNPSYLAVGDSYQQNVNVTLPLNAQGTWYVYVVPDGTGFHHPFAMPEQSRSDKLALSTGFSVTLSPPPDLAVTSVKAPAQDFSGQPMKVSWTVANNGTGPTVAGAWTDTLYMSSSATLDASATPLGSFSHTGVLAAGASYTANQTVTLPVGVSGPFYFLVKTDVKGQVFENGATANNVAATASAETVNLTPPPELDVSAIAAPASAIAGHPLTVSYTVTNNGATATPNYTWNDALYLSPTAGYSAPTAIPLGTPTHQGSLAAGASYTGSVTVTLPQTLSGSYYAIAATDTGHAVFELNRINSVGNSPDPVSVVQLTADLAVTAVSAPLAAVPGSAVPVTWTVANQGSGDTVATAWQDAVYVDTGNALSASATLLGTYAHYGLLGPGGSYSQTRLVTVPINLLGSYHLFVVTNSDHRVYETSTVNDTSAGAALAVQLQVTDGQGNTQQAAVADLAVMSVLSSTISNNSVTVQWVVQNLGTGTTDTTYWNDDVWMSTQPALGAGGTDVFLGSVQHTNPLAPGANYTSTGSFTLPTTFPAGTYYFIVATDRPVLPPSDTGGTGGGRVYDTNTGNNQAGTGTSTSLAPAPLPDLTVSNVSASLIATSGASLPVSWQVNNIGADTGNVTIQDSVYLSFDQVFDPNSDKYLGSVTHTGDLVPHANYSQSASLPLPPGLAGTYYVFVVTNTRKNVVEASTTNDSGFLATAVQVRLSPPADLVAGTITIPATAVAGQPLTLTYQVSNNGSNPANGAWTDSLYLSPTPTWTVGDPLLQQVPETRSLPVGGSYSETISAALPGVAPGSYYVILRTNIRDSFPEQNLANNVDASLTQSAIDAPALTLGSPTGGTLKQGQAVYYKVVVSAGQTLQVTLSGQDATASNELYVSYGTMPTRAKFDYRFARPFQANQQVTVPTTQAGAYYVLVYGDSVPTPPESFTVTAVLVPFSIQSVAPSQAGTGLATLQISGARFDFGTTFQLRAGGTTINATRTLLQDSATAFVTFDLTGQPQGSYDVWATQTDSTTTQLAAGLSVVAATPQNQVQVGLVTPGVVLVGRPGSLTLTYSNPGNTDLPAPLLLLSSPDVQFAVPGQVGAVQSALQLVGFNPSGPYGTLPPGFQGSLTVTFMPVTAGNGLVNNFTLATLADPSQPFDWSAVAANDVPLGTAAPQWASMVAQAAPLLGNTWGSVVAFLDSSSVQLVGNTAAPVDPNALNGLANFDALLQYTIGIYGVTRPAATTPSLPVLTAQGEVTLYNAHVDGTGNPIALNSSYPTFVIVPGWNGYRADFGTLAQTIATDTDCFPSGQVNVIVATWTGSAAGPAIDGMHVPWLASMHVDNAGNDLATLFGTLVQQGKIGLGSTTVLGEGLGVYVGNTAAHRVGGLGAAVALDPASALAGYLPPSLKTYFQQSTAYETSSLYDTQLPIAASNQTLASGDLNNPLLLSTLGVTWINGQVQAGQCAVLTPAAPPPPDVLPPGNDPALPSSPISLVLTSGQVVQIQSHDPNSMSGAHGSGTNNIVPLDRPLPYTVNFENLPTVQAPAQSVTITEQLDPSLDWRTFRLTSFDFGGKTYTVPANSAYYQTTLDLKQQLGFEVDFTATINIATGVATWTFATIDPATGAAPINPKVGLLPPDNANGVGEGFASYTILPKQSDPTGTTVDAQATVTFDTQPPLTTATIFNTLDAGTAMSSTVNTLPAYETTTPFPVSWTGSDDPLGAGVGGYTVYVSDNGGPYTAWLQNTTLSAAPYAGKSGHTYRFYSIATSYDGTVQPTPAAAQASTAVDMTPPTTTAVGFPAAAAYNTNHWTGTLSGSAGDDLSGVQAEQVSILDSATGKYWDGTAFASGSELFFNATLASPSATSTTWSLPFAASNFPADGVYRIHAHAADVAGNVEASGLSTSFTFDSLPPVTTDGLAGTVGTNGWYRSAVSVTLSPSDDASGVASTFYTIDHGSPQTGTAFTVAGDGSHQLTFWSVDKAGNTESTHTDSFKIDRTSPTTTDQVSGTPNSAGWLQADTATVTLSPSDTPSGVAGTFYTIDGGSALSYAGAFIVTGQGSHAITFWSTDLAGNVEAANTDSVKLDNVPPTTNYALAATPGNGSWYTSPVTVTLNPADATSKVAATYYTVNNGSPQTYASPFTVSVQGSDQVAFWSVDNAGNVETSHSVSFQLDSVAPVTTDHQAGRSGANGWFTASPVTVTLDPTDATSGPVATYYTIDGGGPQPYAGAFPVSGDGVHPLTFWSVDAAGNVESPETDAVHIDSIAPVTTYQPAGPAGNAGWYTGAVQVTLTGNDATSKVATTYYTIDSGAAQTYGGPFTVTAAGTHPLTFWSVDKAGNVETAGAASFKIDDAPPVTTDTLSGTAAANGWYHGASVSVTLHPSDATSTVVATNYTVDGGSPQPYTGPFTVSGDGKHPITFWSVDEAGNVEPTEQNFVPIDNGPPTTTDNLVAGWYTTASVPVTLTATDAVGTIAATYFTVDNGPTQTYAGPFPVTGEGPHTITFWSVDAAGNIEAPHADSLQIDSVAPKTTDSRAGTSGSNGWYTSSAVTVTLNAFDATSTVAVTYYTVDGGPRQTYVSAFAVSGAATHRVQFWSVDKAGNTENAETDVIPIDNVAPTTADALTGTAGAAGWYTSSSVNVTLGPTDRDSGVAATYHTVDGGSPQAGTTFIVSGDGNHPITFWSVDKAGNVELAEAGSVPIDTTPPHTTDHLAGTLGTAGWYTSSSVNVTLSPSDATSDVATTYYTIDHGSPQQGTTFAVAGDGPHQVTFWSVDNAGNVEPAGSDHFQIDSTAPHTTDALTGTLSGGWYTSATVSVALTPKDALSGIAATYYTIDGGSPQAGTTFTVSGDGNHPITFWSVDKAGNVEVAEAGSVPIDRTPPHTTIHFAGTLGTNNWYTSATVNVSFDVAEAGSGVAATYYTVDGGPRQTYASSPFAVAGDGPHTFKFWSVDKAGNVETAESDGRLRIDHLAPVTAPPSPTTPPAGNGQFTGRSVAFTLSAADPDPGSHVAATFYTVDGGPAQSYAASPFTVTGYGAHVLTFWSVDTAGNAETPGTFRFTIATPADHLVFDSTTPVQVTTGGTFSLTIDAETSANTLDPNYQGAATLVLTGGPGGKLTGTTIVPIQNGIATFTGLAVSGAGSYALLAAGSASGNSGGSAAVRPAPLTLAAVAAPQFKVTLAPAKPGQTAMGQTFNVIVQAQLGGKPPPVYLGTVRLTSSDPQVTPLTLVFQPGDNGVKRVSLTLSTPGSQTVTVVDTSLPTAKGTSNAANVTGTLPLVIDHFLISGMPATDVVNVAHAVTITAVNVAGKTVTSYSGTVKLTSSDPSFTEIDGIALNHGVGHIAVSLTMLGSQSLFVTDGSGITGTLANVNVVSATTRLAISLDETLVAAGDRPTVSVSGLITPTLADAGFADQLHLTTTDPNAQVSDQLTRAGVPAFDVTFQTAGTQKITVSDPSRPDIPPATLTIVVGPGPVASLQLTGLPLFALPGAQKFTVTAVDLYGNPIRSGFTDTINVAGQTYPFVPADHGAHQFTAKLAAGMQTLTAADSSNPSLPSAAANITVVSAAPSVVPDPLDSTHTALVIVAPAGGATVVITPASADGTTVSVAITAAGKKTTSGPFAPTGHIFVYGQTGTDVVQIAASPQGATVAIPALLFAGSGTGTLSVAGSRANNLLIGGAGAYTLSGGTGRDVLIGGGGPATLRAGQGEDLLIGGSTVYHANLGALAAVLAEWDRTDRTQAERIGDLLGSGNGGLNGTTALSALTVLGDNGVSQLIGNAAAADWFWFSSGAKGTDKLSGVGSRSTATFR